MHCGSVRSSRGDDDVTDRHASVGHGHLLQGGTETGRDIERGAATAPRGSAGIDAARGVQRSGSSLAQRPIWPLAVRAPTATPRSGRLLRDRDRPVGAVGQAGGLAEADKASATRAFASFIGLPAPGLLGSAIRSHQHFSAGRGSSAAQTHRQPLAIFIDKASGQSFADSA
jgi:hypothetical protein